jgi:hypothetical protein
MIRILGADIGVELEKLKELILILLSSQYAKYFFHFRIYYHFNDFTKYLVKRNLDIEQEAFNSMVGDEGGNNNQ